MGDGAGLGVAHSMIRSLAKLFPNAELHPRVNRQGLRLVDQRIVCLVADLVEFDASYKGCTDVCHEAIARSIEMRVLYPTHNDGQDVKDELSFVLTRKRSCG